MNEHFWISLLGAVVCIGAASIFGFNSPSWLRTYTTAARYYYAMAVHMALYVVLMLLVFAPVNVLWRQLGDDPDGTGSLSLAFMVALLVRIVPWFARRMREKGHQLAGIPQTGRRFAAALAEAELQPGEAVLSQAHRTLASRGIDLRRDWLPPVRPVHRQVEQVTALFLQLRGWEDRPAFGAFLAEARNDYDTLRQRFDRLLMRVARSLSNIERVATMRHLAGPRDDGELDTLAKATVDNAVSDLCEDIKHFQHDACLFAARGVMASRWTRSGRTRVLAGLGFPGEHYEPGPGYGLILFQCLLLLYLGCGMYILMTPDTPGVLSDAAGLLLATLQLTFAIGAAIVPKQHWGFANSGILRRTPVAFVAGAGLAAAVVGVLLNVTWSFALLEEAAQRVRHLKEGALYLHALFLTAAAMAWLAQDHRWSGVEGLRRQRRLDAAVFAGTWSFNSLVWAGLVASEGVATWAGLESRPFLLTAIASVLFSLALGGIVGYFVPSAVRTPLPRVVFTTDRTDLALLQAELERCAAGFEDSDAASEPAPLGQRQAVPV
jgi:hypothetical protein